MGASFKTPMPLLWQHDHKAPVGRLMQATPTKQGIKFVAEIPFIREAGKLKERVDEAIHSLKYGLVSAVSIGFRILGGEGEGYDWRDDDRSLDIKQWEWLELSLVTIPANSEAMISAVKSLDQTVNCPAIGETVGPEVYQKSGGSDILKPVRLIPPVYNEDRKVKSGTVKLLQGD
jgi:HK97 family phage prohead protease